MNWHTQTVGDEVFPLAPPEPESYSQHGTKLWCFPPEPFTWPLSDTPFFSFFFVVFFLTVTTPRRWNVTWICGTTERQTGAVSSPVLSWRWCRAAAGRPGVCLRIAVIPRCSAAEITNAPSSHEKERLMTRLCSEIFCHSSWGEREKSLC